MTGSSRSRHGGNVVALCGGIGGAKLALGLSKVIADERLVVAVNTGDDFEHLGLHISPDVDTVTYTLAGIANPETGWGRADETWNFMESLGRIGGETWFQLGDRDLALHVERTRRLRAGDSLSEITADMRARLGISARILPMSDDPVRTHVETDAGPMPFQNYFVERKCEPELRSIRFVSAQSARVQPDVARALGNSDLRCVIICPSNPYLSVDPILAVGAMRELLRQTRAPVVAVSPLVDGQTVKGPMSKIMREQDLEARHATIARHYDDVIDGLMIDSSDDQIPNHISTTVEDTMMHSLDDKVRLARHVLAFADEISAGRELPQARRA
ncbi:MAG: 2-phospho-L-lactate transferase [Hyphomicrobiaceae bacterium]|nr:2-phospho-L-lactate transferase [Hyphomicrobiaceae bacterium]